MGLFVLGAVGINGGRTGQKKSRGREDESGMAKKVEEEEMGRGGGKASYLTVP